MRGSHQLNTGICIFKAVESFGADFKLIIGEIAAMVDVMLNYFLHMSKREYGITLTKYKKSMRCW